MFNCAGCQIPFTLSLICCYAPTVIALPLDQISNYSTRRPPDGHRLQVINERRRSQLSPDYKRLDFTNDLVPAAPSYSPHVNLFYWQNCSERCFLCENLGKPPSLLRNGECPAYVSILLSTLCSFICLGGIDQISVRR